MTFNRIHDIILYNDVCPNNAGESSDLAAHDPRRSMSAAHAAGLTLPARESLGSRSPDHNVIFVDPKSFDLDAVVDGGLSVFE